MNNGATGPSIRGVTTREVAAHRYSIDLSENDVSLPCIHGNSVCTVINTGLQELDGGTR